VRGNAKVLSAPSLGSVGKRHLMPYGRAAERLLNDLALRGLVIAGRVRRVSAHADHGALNRRGKTVAVCGTGMNVPYPRDSMRIGGEIVASGGALICEFPARTPAVLKSFPIRNRIIGRGFSLGGASECSRAPIAARCAAQQRRDIFVAPGNRANQDSFRPITLIRQGAKLTARWQNVWQELPAYVRRQLEANGWVESSKLAESSVFSDLPPSPPQKRICAQLKPTRVARSTKSLKSWRSGLLTGDLLRSFCPRAGSKEQDAPEHELTLVPSNKLAQAFCLVVVSQQTLH